MESRSNKFNLSDDQVNVLATFEALRKPVSFRLAALLSQLPGSRLKELVGSLKERKWLVEQADFGGLGPDLPKALKQSLAKHNNNQIVRIFNIIKSSHISHHDDVCSILDLYLEKGKYEEATLLAWQAIRSSIREQRYKDALAVAVLVVSQLEEIIKHSGLWKSTVDLVIIFTKLANYNQTFLTKTKKALKLVQEPCRLLGDERRLALVLLHLGRIYASFLMLQKSFEYLCRGFDIVERLGDRDIEVQAAPFYGFYYAFQGLSRKAVAHFQQIDLEDQFNVDSVPDPQVAATAGIQAALAGEFPTAIGALNAKWRRAALAGDKWLANVFRAYLGQVLLMKGLLDEARLHLDAVLEEIKDDENSSLYLFTLRAKAYYLFRLGRIHEAYEMLRDSLGKFYQQGGHKLFYTFPRVLEMLFCFKKNGYPPISGYEFQPAMVNMIASPNVQLRGTALRIQASEALEAGESLEVVKDLLLKSEKYFTESGNPGELVKTRIQLSLLFNQQGDRIKARTLARQAWDARFSMSDQAFPREIKPLIDDLIPSASEPSNYRDILLRFLDMLAIWSPGKKRQETLYQMIMTTTRFLCAERGAVFLFKGSPKNQRLLFAEGCNFKQDDIEEGDLQIYRKQTINVLETNEPMIIREHVSKSSLRVRGVKSILCIPFNVGNEEHGMLYYDTMHIDRAFDWCDKTTLAKISESIQAFFSNLWKIAEDLDRKPEFANPSTGETSEKEFGFFKTSGYLFQNVIQKADSAAFSDAPVLILGETGAGKEIIAKRVHLMSSRRNNPFITVNLSSIPESLIESELFGHEKGAFTGADRQKLGRLELANKGTLFLDEVGEIPHFVQVKLLRVLEEMSFIRIGGIVKRDVDFRLIAATNRDLTKEVEKGNFRADLFYRLHVIPIFVPPLRERGEDIIELAQKILNKFAKKYQKPVISLSPEAKNRLMEYHWPGNVRELKNTMERAVILNTDPGRLTEPIIGLPPNSHCDVHISSDKPTLDEVQRRYINQVLEETDHNVTRTASILGMKRNTLYKRMHKLGIN